METGKNTSADRNRKQTGKSEEIVADSAICTCDKGSKPGTFRVTSQQKIYCNGARKLVATDQDKDTKSLNFGSCAAKNNGPCSPNIVWSNTYNKIAIKGKMYPLTVKSSGTCKAGGGRINIQTSGQQVVVKPSASPRKANSTAHKSPVFTEEDWKHLPQEDEKSQNKRVPAAVQVNNVLVNGKREITITPYDQEELLFTTSLTAGSMRGTGVKWDVCHGNRVIAKGLTEAPARTYFTKEGTYSVYAYVHKPGSPKGKGVVTITVSYPKLERILWKDENGRALKYIGRNVKSYAHIFLKGARHIQVFARFFFNNYGKKELLSEFSLLTQKSNGEAVISLFLSDSQIKKIEEKKEKNKDKTLNIFVEIKSSKWIEDYAKSKMYPIIYDNQEKIISLELYKDKGCEEKLEPFVKNDSLIYVKLIIINLQDKEVRMNICQNIPSTNNTEKEKNVRVIHSMTQPYNSTGAYVFSFKVSKDWIIQGTSRTFYVEYIKPINKTKLSIGSNSSDSSQSTVYSTIKKSKIFSLELKNETKIVEHSKTGIAPVKNNDKKQTTIIFPLLKKPQNDYKNKWGDTHNWAGKKGSSMAVFGAARKGKRLHAARDLYTNGSENVVAICPGKVLGVNFFYDKTYEVTVLHTTEDGRKFIVRYGELDRKSITVSVNQTVRQRQIIGKTGKLLNKKNKPTVILNNTVVYMLHFEYFSGSEGYNINKSLTQKPYSESNRYVRRKDLLDPLDILREGYENTFKKGLSTDDKDRIPISALKISNEGLEFIKSWESFSSKAYDDSMQYATIGWGHLIANKSCNEIRNDTSIKWPLKGVSKEDFVNGISSQKATILFTEDIKKAEDSVKNNINVPLHQYEYDALVSLVYNCGSNFLSTGGKNKGDTKIKKYINDKDYYAGAKEFLDVTNGGLKGLVNRRNGEFEIFTNNIYANHK